MERRHSPWSPEQLHHAAPAANPQLLLIAPRIPRLLHPALGFPALLGPDHPLVVVLSLPVRQDPREARFSVVDRHRSHARMTLPVAGEPVSLGGASGDREVWSLALDLENVPSALYDLVLERHGETELQLNSVRIYTDIRGDETVTFSGDSQYHGLDHRYVERWVSMLNPRDDIAWVALVGEVCGNDVQSAWHTLQRSAGIGPGPVMHHDATEDLRYAPGDDAFAPREPEIVHGRGEALPEALEGLLEADAAPLVEVAAAAQGGDEAIFFGSDDLGRWSPSSTGAQPFLHVDDVGAYDEKTGRELAAFGYAEVRLRAGAPVAVGAINRTEKARGTWQSVVAGGNA